MASLVTLVLIGPHAAGKSTVGATLSRVYGMRFDGEVGLELRDALRDSNATTARGAFDAQPGFEISVLSREAARDDAHAAGVRVVETWHAGNLAWASARSKSDGNAFEQLFARTMDAVSRHKRKPGCRVFVQPLTASPTTVAARRSAGAGARVPSNGDENGLLCATQAIGDRASLYATELGLTLLSPIATDSEPPESSARRTADALLAAVCGHPPTTAVPSRTQACDILAAAAALGLLPPAAAAAFPSLARRAHARPSRPLPSLIAIEGLDGVGKSTLCRALAAALGGVDWRSPPRSLDSLRPLFTSSPAPPLASRAFYVLGNHVAAAEVGEVGNASHLVILDRFHLSTAAYALSDRRVIAPGAGDHPGSDWDWPESLPVPALTLLLRFFGGDSDSEESRWGRLRGRGGGWGTEEDAQAADATLAARIEGAYERLSAGLGRRGGRVVVLDAAATPDRVLEAAVGACRVAGLARVGGAASQKLAAARAIGGGRNTDGRSPRVKKVLI